MSRLGIRSATALGAALVTAALVPSPMRANGDTSPPSLFSLSALLTVSPELPPLAARVLVSEAEQIWRREGVTLKWPSPRGPAATSAPLRILVIARREVVMLASKEQWPVAELVQEEGQRPLAIASIAGAERVLAEATRNRVLDGRGLAEFRLGVVLGRAVAHEIGHYLLATKTHADRGLMRAAINAYEFADPGAGSTFVLDEAAGHWLRHRLLASHTAIPPLLSAGFSYASPSEILR